MSATLFTAGKFQGLDANGLPVSGGSLYTYAAGTLTPQPTYTTQAATSANTNPVILDAAGRANVWTDVSLAYRMVLKDALGNTIWDVDNIPANNATSVLSASLASTSSAAAGPALIGFNPTLNYAAGTVGQHIGVVWNPQDYPWLAKFDGATDDTAALTACLTAIYNAGGGIMQLPRGTTMVSSLAFNFAASKSVLIRGAGRNATFIRCNGGSSPVLNISANTGVLDVYSEISDLTIDGAAKTTGRHGLQLTTISNITTRNLGIINCDTALNSLGCLVSNHYSPSWNSCNVGFACAKSGAIYANLVNFWGGAITLNSSWGLTLDGCSNAQFFGVDIEGNGTTATLTTGQVQTATTIAAEIGFAQLLFIGCWFENGLGQPINIQAAGGLHVNFTSCKFPNSQGGRVMTVAAINSISLIHCEAGSASDTVTLAAANSYIEGGIISTVTDTSTNQTRINVTGLSASPGSFHKNLLATNMLVDPAGSIRDNTGVFSQGAPIVKFRDGGLAGNSHTLFATNGGVGNAAACAFNVGANSATSRSINAGGTVNASGADYAEYETKRDDCGAIAAGQIVGFDANGLITDKFSLSLSFGIKSTAPAIVGGDSWGSGLEGEALEAARAKVDRIAYSGKVPVNVAGASPGQWINVTANTDDSIAGVAQDARGVSTVGQVRRILADGRAEVRVA